MTTRRRVCFLVSNVFTERDYERYGVETFLKDGFEVEVIEITPIILKDLDKFSEIISGRHQLSQVCHHAEEVRKIVERWRDISVTVVTFCQPNKNTLDVFKVLSGKCQIVVANLQAIPSYSRFPIWVRRTWWFKMLKSIIRGKDSVEHEEMSYRELGLPQAEYFLVSGSISEKSSHSLVGPKTKMIKGHSFDFEVFRNQSNSENDVELENSGYFVFLDEFLPYHPDFVLQKSKSYSEPEVYYQSINALFDEIENQTGKEIIVCAHPKSDYETRPGIFGHREVVKGQSIEKTRNCEGVILHASTALSFAVLYDKPLLFVSMEEFESQFFGNVIDKLASCLGCRPIIANALHRKRVGQQDFTLDEKRFKTYKRDYFKSPDSPDEALWKIVSSAIESNVTRKE